MLLTERNILTKGKAQRQIYVEVHHEQVQDCELRGQGETSEWNTDLIETKKLENYTCQVAHDLYNGEAQHEPRGAHEEQHCKISSRNIGIDWERSRSQGNLDFANPGYEW